MSAPTRWERALRIGMVLVGLQAALAMAAYFQVHRMTLSHTVRVYAEARPLPGASWPVRVSVIDEAARRPAPWTSATLRVGGASDALREIELAPEGGATGNGVANVTHLPTPAAIELEAHVSGVDALLAQGRVESREWPDALRDPASLSAEPTPRRPDLGGEGDQPRVWVRRAEDACPMKLSVVANGGVAARDLENALYLRLTHADGAPAAGVSLRVRPYDAAAPTPTGPLTTDSMGVAVAHIRPLVAASWWVAWECAGLDVERRVSWVPSWDGIVLHAHVPLITFGDAVVLEASHQRGFGTWKTDVRCDGRWTMTGSDAVQHGTRRVGVPLGLGAAPPRPLWCTISGTTVSMSPDPPRGQTHLVVLPADATRATALAELARAYREHAPSAIREQLGDATLDAIARAPDAALDGFAAWLIHSLPYAYEPPPLWRDSGPGARAAMSERRSHQLRVLSAALALDLVVVFGFVVGIVFPRAQRQRRRLEALYEEVGPAEDDASDDADLRRPLDRPWLVFALGLGVIASCALGLIALLSVLR